MSNRELRLGHPLIGDGASYHNVPELVRDKDQIDAFAKAIDVSRRNVRKDPCGQWTISGKTGHVQTWGDQPYYLLYVVAHSNRKWGAIKRKAEILGWELVQDGDDEGCFRLGLPDNRQAGYLRSLLRLRRKRQAKVVA